MYSVLLSYSIYYRNRCPIPLHIRQVGDEEFCQSIEWIFLVQYDQCLQDRLEKFSKEQSEMNAIFNHEPIQYGEIVSLPFTGSINTLCFTSIVIDSL